MSSFTASLPSEEQARINSKLTTLRQLGLAWRSNSIKSLGEHLYEMKVGQARLYFGLSIGNELIFIECHLKKSKKEQSRVIDTAKKTLKWLQKNREHANVSDLH